MVGGAIAGFVYWFFIEAHHTSLEPEDKQPSSDPEDGSQNDLDPNTVHTTAASTDNLERGNGNELHGIIVAN